jgi:hypothetical protein
MGGAAIPWDERREPRHLEHEPDGGDTTNRPAKLHSLFLKINRSLTSSDEAAHRFVPGSASARHLEHPGDDALVGHQGGGGHGVTQAVEALTQALLDPPERHQ